MILSPVILTQHIAPTLRLLRGHLCVAVRGATEPASHLINESTAKSGVPMDLRSTRSDCLILRTAAVIGFQVHLPRRYLPGFHSSSSMTVAKDRTMPVGEPESIQSVDILT